MFTVYVLYSEKYDKLYIGSTSDLKQRLLSHNELARKGWTVKYRPWKLIYSEELTDKNAEMKREKELKSHKGRDFLRSLII
jgi:putative endonuclease